jgi:hypothetical protein
MARAQRGPEQLARSKLWLTRHILMAFDDVGIAVSDLYAVTAFFVEQGGPRTDADLLSPVLRIHHRRQLGGLPRPDAGFQPAEALGCLANQIAGTFRFLDVAGVCLLSSWASLLGCCFAAGDSGVPEVLVVVPLPAVDGGIFGR